MKKLCLLFIILSFCTKVYAQGRSNLDESSLQLNSAMRDIYIVGGSSLVGAILGLSTLSFVNEPQEHFDNVVVGGALGIIVGVSIVVWMQATKSKAIIGTKSDFKDSWRYGRKKKNPALAQVQLKFNF